MRNSQIAFAHSLHISSVGISVMLFLDCSRNLVTNSFESINRPPQAGFPDGGGLGSRCGDVRYFAVGGEKCYKSIIFRIGHHNVNRVYFPEL